MASPDAGEPAPRPPMTLETLPAELQREIVGHCSQSDLICLSLVSKHFRDLAAAQLYRNFHIVFPDEDDPAFDSPIDGLAGGLDTFVTSDYDYAKHLRDLSLDTLSAGAKAETAYKPYLYSVSCGKFMNTLLLLTLRKAKSLESFRYAPPSARPCVPICPPAALCILTPGTPTACAWPSRATTAC